MNCENTKPSDVIFVMLLAIAAIPVNAARLVVVCLWISGRYAVKLLRMPEDPETDSKSVAVVKPEHD